MIIEDIIYWYFSYFTNWNLTLVFLYLLGYIPKDYKDCIIYLANIALIGGLFICYIKPRYIYTPYFGGLRFTGLSMYIADFITHFLPRLLLQVDDIKINLKIPYMAILLGLIYLSVNSPERLYNINKLDILAIILASTVLYIVIPF